MVLEEVCWEVSLLPPGAGRVGGAQGGVPLFAGSLRRRYTGQLRAAGRHSAPQTPLLPGDNEGLARLTSQKAFFYTAKYNPSYLKLFFGMVREFTLTEVIYRLDFPPQCLALLPFFALVNS